MRDTFFKNNFQINFPDFTKNQKAIKNIFEGKKIHKNIYKKKSMFKNFTSENDYIF